MELIQTMKFLLLLILLMAGGFSQSQIAFSEESVSDSKEAISGEQSNQKLTPEQQERRKQMISASWIMLVGVAILGGILLLIVFLFGNRIRRIARKPLPDAPLRDPMWYLKNKANDTSELTDEAADTDHE